jgi:murein DD-endopeptidase MepM/ murein hydrolase activator NlpD
MAEGMSAGSVWVRLGGIFDRKGFDDFEANTVKAQKVKDIKARLGGDFDSRDFDLYQKRLDETRERTKLRGAIKATLGADYDARAFNAYYRDLTKAKAASIAAADGPGRLSIAFNKLAKSAGGAGGAMGGGRGLGGILPGLGGGFIALVGSVAALLPVLLAVAGAATALAGSLAAAAAGAAAVGVGIGAALGPLAAIAGAVALRVTAMSAAFKSLGTEQVKGGAQATASAEAQRAAAQRVQDATENLTKARLADRREVEDLTAAVERSTRAEQDAAIALRETQESSAAVLADPRSTALARDRARQDVTDAKARVADAATERQRAITDEKLGTDTLRQAQKQLTEARHAATIATQKEGAAATDANQKLGELSATERRLVVDFKAFVDQLTKIFKPATDAIFGSVDRGLRLITPLVGRYKDQFGAIGQAIADVVDAAGKSLTGPGWVHALDSFVATAQRIVKPIADSVGSVLVILRNIAVATQPLVVELARNISSALGGLADKTKDPAKVRDVIKGLVDQTKSWLGFMSAVAKLIFTIFSGGARQGQGLLDQITGIVRKWTAFLETEEGQRKMREFFKDSIEMTKKIAGFLSDVLTAFYKVGDYLLKHTGMIKAAALAWAGYKVAALTALAVTKGAAVASFIKGPAAAGGVSAAGSVLTKGSPLAGAGAGAAGAGVAGVGGVALATGVGVAALGAYLTLMSMLERKSRQLGDGMQVAVSAAKKFAEAGNPAAVHKLADSIDDWGKKTGATKDQITELKDVLAGFETAAKLNVEHVAEVWGKTLPQVRRDAAAQYALMFKDTDGHLSDIRKSVRTNMAVIKQRLGEDSDAGGTALADNFRQAAAAVKKSMDAGKISTQTGMAEIRRLMVKALVATGTSEQSAQSLIDHGVHETSSGSGSADGAGGGAARARGGWVRRAVGGWLGARGMVSDDIVPIGDNAIAALGEYLAVGPGGQKAVINRHQAPFADAALAASGMGSLDTLPTGNSLPFLERALAPVGGLDSLFANVRTPHYYAAGGRVQLPETFTATHQTEGLSGYPAVDVFGSPGSSVLSPSDGTISRFSGKSPSLGAYLGAGGPFGWSMYLDAAKASYFLTHFGSRSVSVGQKVRRGQMIGTVGDYPGSVADHIHEGRHGGGATASSTAASSGGSTSAPLTKIKAPKTQLKGVVGKVVQGALNVVTKGANSRLAEIIGGSALPGASGGTASGNGAALIRQISKQRGWNFGDWWALDGSETSHGANLSNPTSSARLRGQFLDSNYGKYGPGSDPSKNPSMSQQIQSMARYIAERYGNPTKAWAWHQAHNWYAKGGRIAQRLASGGRVGDLMDRGWSAMKGILPGAAPSTPPAFVVSDLVPGAYAHAAYALHGGRRRIALTKEMVDDLRAGKGPNYGRALHALTHEWAHTQQKPSMARQPPWIVEGGAEAFARDNDARIWGGKARSYGAYSDFVSKVRKTAYLGKAFINSGQFIGGKVLNFATGGRALRFAPGGRVPTSTGGSAQRLSGSGTGGTNITALAGTQRIRIKSYDNLTTQVADDERRYGQAERKYNQSDEVLIDPVTGELNQDAIEHRAGELDALMKIRKRILKYLEDQLAIARRVVKTYTTIINRLTRSLKHAKGKDRSGIKASITAYGTERDSWETNVKNVGFDVGDAKLDIGDLQKEGSELRGTVATPTDATATSDTTTDTSSGTDTTASNPDVDAVIARFQTAAANAQANLVSANQVIAAFGSSGDIGTGGSNAINAVRNEAAPVGAQFAPAGSIPAAAPTINNYYNMPGSPNVLRAIGDAATAGQSLQPSVNSSIDRLGI